jgi:uncharacterized protein YhbP (UPF0306 family)
MPPDIGQLLNSQSTLALATCDADGTPRIAPLFYITDEKLRLYWFSAARSAHSRNLKRDPRAAVTVHSGTDRWQEIRGVQMRGRVHVVTDRELRRTIAESYAKRFRLGKLFQAAMTRSRLYCFEASWIRPIDPCTVER